ncbi:MAG: OmpA family protein [Melioribacteraceae bacterium]|nr:OmpA family protein [Melioribacteraceae bacterium]MCF8265415.1 OmpA family protein [Melioribacteraceae bacterium]MCF8431209.1 OmpA family protein [Melioribacteraceae bacterium]
MKRIIYCITFWFFISNIAHAQGKTVNLKLNALDFSRYPTVDLFATFTDGNGDPIQLDQIEKSNKILKHNGTIVNVQDIISVYDLKSKGETELYLTLVFDNSKSMLKRNDLLEKAAESFIDGITPGDRVSIIDFGDEQKKETFMPELEYPVYPKQRIGFSNSKKFLREKIKTPYFTDRTFMYDALIYALSVTKRADVLGKKIIIFFSDGDNIGSETNYDKVQEVSKLYDIPIYAIDLNIRTNSQLQDLAKQSRGEYYIVNEPRDLAPVYQSLLKLLRSQYRISYRSPDEGVNSDYYNVNLNLPDLNNVSDVQTFKVEGEKIGYFNLAYLESQGKESIDKYMDYLIEYPVSKYADDVQLRMGNYWFARGEYGNALGVYNKILRNENSSSYFSALSQKADLLLKAEDWFAAKEAYNQIVNSRGGSDLKPKALLDLASLQSSEGNFMTALDTYSKLVTDFEGTEFASEGLLQSSLLNLEMGNLNQAVTNLNNIVSNYGETNSALFAEYELGKIAQSQNELDKALAHYDKVINSNIDPDIREQSTFESANIMMSLGNYAGAIGLLSSLVQTSSNLGLVSQGNALLVESFIKTGDLLQAQQTFNSMPLNQQQNLLGRGEISASLPGNYIVSLMNAAHISAAGSEILSNSIRLIEDANLRAKYSILGQIYYFTINSATTTINAAIPVKPEWIEQGLLENPNAGVYSIVDNQIRAVTKSYNTSSQSFQFNVIESGHYMLLTEAPKIITLYDIYFDVGKASIRKDAEKNLYEMIDMLKEYPAAKMEIAGHTDSTGTDEVNMELSLSRATSIKRFMVKNGIEANRLDVKGYGSRFPVAPNINEENRQKNRRTEFIVISGLEQVATDHDNSEERYAVVIASYNSLREVTEQKSFINKRGYQVSVITSINGSKSTYELLLGVYSEKSTAEKEANSFIGVFQQFEPLIKKL